MLYIGTSGWQYRHWRGRFYPSGVPARAWLDYYIERFATVEINNTFYRLPPRETFELWAKRFPADYVIAAKVSRYLTHIKRLREPEEPVQRFLEHAEPLGPRLGPVLVQLPPNLPAEAERLDATLTAFGPGRRIAVEPRHESWFVDDVRSVLERHNAALCLADRGSRLITPAWRTADWGYVRFHFGRAQPRSCYGRASLVRWVDRVCDLWGDHEDVFAYFNNDGEGCAVRDAVVFARLAAARGLHPTRTPQLDEAPVG
ncbi:MAG: hypothetical protein QOI55_104 [Actinomycetota bacterium]|nr:hypothetical protein [Actinomycetota bacterium]